MTRSITLRPDARADLADIWSYSADQWGDEQADSYLNSVQFRIAAVAANPKLGSDCGELYPSLRRVKAGSHLIYYLATDTLLDAIRILHARRDTISRLSEAL